MNITKIYKLFPDEKACIAHLEGVRWGGKPRCVYCQSFNSSAMPNEGRHHCNNCKSSYSVTVGTIFHRTHLPLQKWFLAISLILNARKGISARQLARDIDVNRNTAWRISMQIRKAMSQTLDRELLKGLVEADETYVGGKPRRGDPNSASKRGRGTKKIPVVGMIERGGKVKASVAKKKALTSKKLSTLVRRNVDTGNSVLITDEYKGYLGIKKFMPHQTINHQTWYVDGSIHTNNIESFWAILKRGIIGQFHKVSLNHLPRYIDEFVYRFNQRNNVDAFGLTVQRALGGLA